MLLNTARWAWKDGSKTHLQYILDDATRAFLTLSDDMLYEDFDIFIEDTTKNQQYIETLKQLMQPAMQNGASLLDIAEIITMDNISMIKSRLEEIEQKRMEQQQAMEQAQVYTIVQYTYTVMVSSCLLNYAVYYLYYYILLQYKAISES